MLRCSVAMGAGWKRTGENAFMGAGGVSLTVEHRYPFTSLLKRMATVVRVSGPTPNLRGEAMLVAKGAPEIMQPLLSEIPANYEACYKAHASQGSRCIPLLFTTFRKAQSNRTQLNQALHRLLVSSKRKINGRNVIGISSAYASTRYDLI